jgi:diguanylate cyclase (GGDEF)-like protein
METSRLTGHFASHADEAAFLDHKNAQTRPLLGFTLVFCTLFYVAFSVTDWAALGLGRDFFLLLGARLLVAAVAGTCAWLAYRRPLSVRATRITACVAEAAALACFMFIASLRPLEFHWHAMSLAIMLIVIYLYIPNKLANAAVLASLATAAFFTLALRLSHLTRADLVTMGMLLALANAFGALAARRFNRASREEYRAQTQLQHAAERDHLTGCYNRRYLNERLLERELLRARRFGHSLTVLLCDIDNFKRINDTYGHADGDAVLRSFAALLTRMTRHGVDSVVRYGGEEFLAILPETGLQGGTQLAERLRATFAATCTPSANGGDSVCTTASFGVACADFTHDADHDTLRELISAADKLMYEAKRSGRDCVRALQLA